MRIKIILEKTGSNIKRKVCYWVDQEHCSKVGDLCYLVKERYFHLKGSLALSLDGFLLPPEEDIKLIQENDVINAKFCASRQNGIDASIKEHSKRMRKSEAESTSSSSESEEDATLSKRKPKLFKSDTKPLSSKPSSQQPSKKLTTGDKVVSSSKVTSSNKITNKSLPNGKKTLPISKLGVTRSEIKPAHKKMENSDTTSGSTDSSSSSSEDESVPKKKSTAALKSLTNNKKVISSSSNVEKTAVTKINIPSKSKNMKPALQKKNMSSSSSDSSDSSDSSHSDTKKKNEIKVVSSVDFHVTNGKASTPSDTTIPWKVNKCYGNTGKQTSMSGYRNVSSFITSKPFISPNLGKDSNMNTKSNISGNSTNTSLNTSSNIADASATSTTKASRKRRRRQKKIAYRKGEKNGNMINLEKVADEKGVLEVDSKTCEIDGATNNSVEEINPTNTEPIICKKNESSTASISIDPVEIIAQPSLKDYSSYTLLENPPNTGDMIAYKIMELTSTYEPNISNYKEGCVKDYDKENKILHIRLSDSSLKKGSDSHSVKGKFEMPMLDGDEENTDIESLTNVSISWNDLIEPRLLDQNIL